MWEKTFFVQKKAKKRKGGSHKSGIKELGIFKEKSSKRKKKRERGGVALRGG